MKSNPPEAVTYLELIAAKAKQLAEDCKQGRLWDGDLRQGLDEISYSLKRLEQL